MKCSKCGNEVHPSAAFCDECGQPLEPQRQAEQRTQAAMQQPVEEKRENTMTGTVGALIGAAIGSGCIILLSQMGFVAALSGLVMAVCTLKGYELLGGKLSKKGVIISLVIMLLMPYLADRIDWAIVVMDAYASDGVTFSEAFASIHYLIEEDIIEAAAYWKNLLMIYAFTALGAFGTLRSAFKK